MASSGTRIALSATYATRRSGLRALYQKMIDSTVQDVIRTSFRNGVRRVLSL